MTQVILDVPENELEVVVKFAKDHGYSTSFGMSLSDKQKKILDDIEMNAKDEDFIPLEVFNKKIHEKYGL